MSEKSFILFADISLSQADTESVVQTVVSPFQFDDLEGKIVGEKAEVSPMGGPVGPVEENNVCKTEAGT